MPEAGDGACGAGGLDVGVLGECLAGEAAGFGDVAEGEVGFGGPGEEQGVVADVAVGVVVGVAGGVAGGVEAAQCLAGVCLRLRRAGDAWHVAAGGLSASAPSVVIAAGTLTPSLLAAAAAANGFRTDAAFEVTQTTVLGIPGLALPGVVCIGGGPHLIPHRTAEDCGATLCVPFDNQPACPETVHCSPDAAARDRVLGCVREHAPGLMAMLEGRRTFWYSCQKLIPSRAADRPDWRHGVLTEAAPGLWAAYAGKFTTAPVLAGHVAQLLGGSLPAQRGAPGRGTVEVADQPFRAERTALVP